MNALSNAPQHSAQLSGLAPAIGWERNRVSHHLQRIVRRGFVDRLPSDTDGRATDAALTDLGWKGFRSRVPRHPAWVECLLFTDLTRGQARILAAILTTVYETILCNGTLPPPDFDEQRSLAAP